MITTSGRVTLVAAILLLALGIAMGYPEVIVLALTCVLLVVVAAIWMLARPDVVVVREIRPVRVSVGEEALGNLHVTNASRRRSPPILAVEAVGSDSVSVPVPSLAGGRAYVSSYSIPTDRRGVFPVGPLTIGHADPLRLLQTVREHATRSTLWVHPQVHDVEPLPTSRSRDLEGPTTSSSPQGGIAFHTLRDYVRGDDLRLVHWPSTARAGHLMVRHNVVPNEPRMMVVLDTSAAAYEGDSFEDAVRVAASLSVAACNRHFPLELRTTAGGMAVAERSVEDRTVVLDLLAEARASSDDRGIQALLQMIPRDEGVTLGVVTGQVDAAATAAITAVRPRFHMVSVVQVGERYDRPPTPIRGTLTVSVATSDDFASVWNRRVRG